MNNKWLTIPNIFSLSRIFSVPFLIYLAYKGHENPFLILLVLALSTDAIDGYLARKLNQITKLGTTLDSVGDMAMYFTVPIGAWLLWPDIIKERYIYIIIAMLTFIIPILYALIKFGWMPSYHTYLAKFSTINLSITCLIWFATKIFWPFQIAVLIQILVMTEYLAITIYLKKWRGNIPSYWHATGKLGNK